MGREGSCRLEPGGRGEPSEGNVDVVGLGGFIGFEDLSFNKSFPSPPTLPSTPTPTSKSNPKSLSTPPPSSSTTTSPNVTTTREEGPSTSSSSYFYNEEAEGDVGGERSIVVAGTGSTNNNQGNVNSPPRYSRGGKGEGEGFAPNHCSTPFKTQSNEEVDRLDEFPTLPLPAPAFPYQRGVELIGEEERRELFNTPRPGQVSSESEWGRIQGSLGLNLGSAENSNNNSGPVYCRINYSQQQGKEKEREQSLILRRGCGKTVYVRPKRPSKTSVTQQFQLIGSRRKRRREVYEDEEREEDEEEEEEDDEPEETGEVSANSSFDLELAGFNLGSLKDRRSSYSGIRGPRADAKALNLLTNCPLGVKWLVDNFEYYPARNLPRGFVYDQYVLLCNDHHVEPVNAASFGKMIRSVFPGLKTRRLGTRGNSKYHYNGVYLRDDSPLMAIFNLIKNQHELNYDGSGKRGRKVRRPGVDADDSFIPSKGNDSFVECSISKYLSAVQKQEIPPVPLEISFEALPANLNPESIPAFEAMYMRHCEALLGHFERFELKQVFEEWKRFWRVKCCLPLPPQPEGDESVPYREIMSKATLFKICSLEPVQDFIVKMDLYCYHGILNILFPCLARGMPMSMINAMRNFIRDVEYGLFYTLDDYPLSVVGVKMRSLRVFVGKWNEYSKLNRMMKTAASTIRNEDNVRAMQTELNRCIEFPKIQEHFVNHLKITESAVRDRLLLKFRDVLDHTNPNHQTETIKLWLEWASDVAEKVVEENERKVAEGEFADRAQLEPANKLWDTTSEMIMGAIYMSNAVSHQVFKAFLVWCSNTVKHFVKLNTCRSEGFEHPIFHDYQNSQPFQFKRCDPIIYQPIIITNPGEHGQAIHVQFQPIGGASHFQNQILVDDQPQVMEMEAQNYITSNVEQPEEGNINAEEAQDQNQIILFQDGQVYYMDASVVVHHETPEDHDGDVINSDANIISLVESENQSESRMMEMEMDLMEHHQILETYEREEIQPGWVPPLPLPTSTTEEVSSEVDLAGN